MELLHQRNRESHQVYQICDDPIALIRAQHRLEFPWVSEKIRRHIGYHAEILDLGCGYGFLPNDLALQGYKVTGLDLSVEALKVAAALDETRTVSYCLGDVYRAPFTRHSFDVVTAMDLLEHVDDRAGLFAEAARLLRPGGLFIYNTLNRHPLAWLVGVHGVQLIKSAPADYHVYSLFSQPRQVYEWLEDAGLTPLQTMGVRPIFWQRSLWNLWRRGEIDGNFRYCFTRSKAFHYLGCAQKVRNH